ncbi:MAG: DUF3341 domain-containing protein [Salibacteraceae bacterium]|jgi:hypothetical protein|nr:DUF3341 domain-containing protein [Salibacteraceae bacterium]MDP4687756.1 DUF3341 domain-containing protein [Salibacteraceae bacterium]MDP4762915.1 DUF3341 domain-containing protein [Salibacteraceae bacterium]MDP4843894.1 DUF3341 domain-containing protein [Salibacteraceae bacterium]MDP4933789.1 DUF3341 domain-containing protein [Salibacteraceae bacterium]
MSKAIYALYDDDEIMVEGAKSILSKNIRIKDVYSPFPIHGLENVLGIKWTRLAITAFLYGLTATTLALIGMYYFMIEDWPMNIGGKPSMNLYQNLPAFIPITFEFTVLCAAHGMAITYFVRNGLFPGMPARNPHPRTTDDHFAIEIMKDENGGISDDEIRTILQDTNPVEIFEK